MGMVLGAKAARRRRYWPPPLLSLPGPAPSRAPAPAHLDDIQVLAGIQVALGRALQQREVAGQDNVFVTSRQPWQPAAGIRSPAWRPHPQQVLLEPSEGEEGGRVAPVVAHQRQPAVPGCRLLHGCRFAMPEREWAAFWHSLMTAELAPSRHTVKTEDEAYYGLHWRSVDCLRLSDRTPTPPTTSAPVPACPQAWLRVAPCSPLYIATAACSGCSCSQISGSLAGAAWQPLLACLSTAARRPVWRGAPHLTPRLGWLYSGGSSGARRGVPQQVHSSSCTRGRSRAAAGWAAPRRSAPYCRARCTSGGWTRAP